MNTSTYTTVQVHKAMEEIVSKVRQEIEDLNYGGCGWFVHYILKEFERYNVDISQYWVVYLVDYGFYDEEEIEYNLKNRTGKRSSSHLMIMFDEIYYDGYHHGETYDEDYWDNETQYLVRTNAADMRAACENRWDWNDNYDYKHYNTTLRKIIYNSFRKHLYNGNNQATV